MSLPSPLHRMVFWAHEFLGEVLRPGDSAVDLTAGNGGDTLFLYRCVGEEGRVLAFDIQRTALDEAARRLQADGAAVVRHEQGEKETHGRGVHLILDDHARLGEYCRMELRGVVANLGYLPGGDKAVATAAASVLPALQAVFPLLAPGGRVAVVSYVGHGGGQEEANRVAETFENLSSEHWLTLRIGVPNRRGSPFLLVAEKRNPSGFLSRV